MKWYYTHPFLMHFYIEFDIFVDFYFLGPGWPIKIGKVMWWTIKSHKGNMDLMVAWYSAYLFHKY